MDVQEHSPLAFNLFIGPGLAFDEIVLFDECVVFIVAHGGQLHPANRAVAVPGHVFIGTEPVAGKQDPDAEVRKITLLCKDSRGGELVPAGFRGALVPVQHLALGIDDVAAIRGHAEQGG